MLVMAIKRAGFVLAFGLLLLSAVCVLLPFSLTAPLAPQPSTVGLIAPSEDTENALALSSFILAAIGEMAPSPAFAADNGLGGVSANVSSAPAVVQAGFVSNLALIVLAGFLAPTYPGIAAIAIAAVVVDVLF